jgi:NADPH-dependent curcumin reductase CurA
MCAMTATVWIGSLCLLGQAWLLGAANAAGICEPLREQIEVQIAATGATGFAVIVVDQNVDVTGKVVGTCAKGTRKLVYVRASKASPAAASRPAQPPVSGQKPAPKGVNVITECRDGTVVQGNASCKP